jgi:hypothetical protein
MDNQEQKHPQAQRDRATADSLLQGEPTDFNLAELGRLIIRYRGFPGAKEIQQNLNNILANWQLTEETLFAKTRQIHAAGTIYRQKGKDEAQQDWT